MYPKHCVSVKFRPPQFIRDMKDWCSKHIGEGDEDGDIDGNKWLVYWSGPSIEYGTEYKFWFFEHKDAVLFSLRWE